MTKRMWQNVLEVSSKVLPRWDVSIYNKADSFVAGSNANVYTFLKKHGQRKNLKKMIGITIW